MYSRGWAGNMRATGGFRLCGLVLGEGHHTM